jgi:hypothetical protein
MKTRLMGGKNDSGGWESDGPERLVCDSGVNSMLVF